MPPIPGRSSRASACFGGWGASSEPAALGIVLDGTFDRPGRGKIRGREGSRNGERRGLSGAGERDERLAGEALVDRGVKAAHLVYKERGERRDRRLRSLRLPGLEQRIVVARLAVMLAHELLREIDLAAALVRRLVPEPVLVGRPERVDDHEDAFGIDRELLLPVDVDEAARTDLLLHRRVDLEDRL